MLESDYKVVIIGGGIIGSSISYQLSKQHIKSTLIEKYQIACSASGKAGGFLTRNWSDGSIMQEIHRKSQDLHIELSKELNVPSQRKISKTLSINTYKKSDNNMCDYVSNKVSSNTMDSNNMLVDPQELTHALLNESTKIGSKCIIGNLTNIDQSNNIISVDINDKKENISYTHLIISAGAWSNLINKYIPSFKIPLQSIKSSSVVYKNRKERDSIVLFCEEDENSCHLEVQPRNNGDVQICGLGGSPTLKQADIENINPLNIKPELKRIPYAIKSIEKISTDIKNEPDITQACLRPITNDGQPMIGKINKQNNIYIATGHNCWGILLSAITGVIISELVINGKFNEIDISKFDPNRF